MTEQVTAELIPCKRCSDSTIRNVPVAQCLGCKEMFCLIHLTQHREEMAKEFDRLYEQYSDIVKSPFFGADLNKHLEYVDKWQSELVEYVSQQATVIKELIRATIESMTLKLKKSQAILELEVSMKRQSKSNNEEILLMLSKGIKSLNEKVHEMTTELRTFSKNQLDNVIETYKHRSNKTIELVSWKHLHDIKLDSTYGFMAASSQYIFLGWKDQLAVYNLDGTAYKVAALQSYKQYGTLCDLVWSSTQNCLFILCRRSLFAFTPQNGTSDLLMDPKMIAQDDFYKSITTYQNLCIILSKTSMSIWKIQSNGNVPEHTRNLHLSVNLTLPLMSQASENICCIRTDDQLLVLLIQNMETQMWRFDFYTIQPFRRIHMSIPFDSFNQLNLGLFIPLRNQICLFMNWEKKAMMLVGSNPHCQVVDENAYNACLVEGSRIIVVNHMTCLKVYSF